MKIENTNESTRQSIHVDLDRIARALDLLERAATRQEAEMVTLRARHGRLKDTVSSELQQLDMLLAKLPQKP